jgi:2-hydroxy-3-keto-5-methylthiopentenyl-1-phosphate phosphatase
MYEKIIYIGDGHSDVCPSRCADMVFAKDVLLQTCEEEGTTKYRSFHNFREISDYLKENF